MNSFRVAKKLRALELSVWSSHTLHLHGLTEDAIDATVKNLGLLELGKGDWQGYKHKNSWGFAIASHANNPEMIETFAQSMPALAPHISGKDLMNVMRCLHEKPQPVVKLFIDNIEHYIDNLGLEYINYAASYVHSEAEINGFVKNAAELKKCFSPKINALIATRNLSEDELKVLIENNEAFKSLTGENEKNYSDMEQILSHAKTPEILKAVGENHVRITFFFKQGVFARHEHEHGGAELERMLKASSTAEEFVNLLDIVAEKSKHISELRLNLMKAKENLASAKSNFDKTEKAHLQAIRKVNKDFDHLLKHQTTEPAAAGKLGRPEGQGLDIGCI